MFLICLMCWGGHLFLKGDLDLFCFTKLLAVKIRIRAGVVCGPVVDVVAELRISSAAAN